MDHFPIAQYTLQHIPHILVDDISSKLYKMDPYFFQFFYILRKHSFLLRFKHWHPRTLSEMRHLTQWHPVTSIFPNCSSSKSSFGSPLGKKFYEPTCRNSLSDEVRSCILDARSNMNGCFV
jgi:hypothetical protein